MPTYEPSIISEINHLTFSLSSSIKNRLSLFDIFAQIIFSIYSISAPQMNIEFGF